MESRATNDSQLQVVQPTPIAAPIRGPRLGLPTQGELAALMEYGSLVHKSGLFPNVKSAEAAIVMIRMAHQLGIDEFIAMQNMYMIGGKQASMASLLHTLILRDHGGDAVQIVESTPEQCILSCKRRDAAQRSTVSYTIAEAKQAGVYESNAQWKKYPADMLFARCISRAGRQLFRDSTMGMYTPEELGGTVIEVNGEVVDYGGSPTSSETEPPSSSTDDPRVERAMKRLHVLGTERELSHEQLHDLAVARYGVPSLSDCSLEQLTAMGLAIKECTSNEALDLVVVAKALGEADDRDYLNSISGEVARAALPDGAKELLIETIRRVGDRIAA